MDLNSITVSDFKSQFVRDFPYLPVWSATKTYNQGAIVYYEANELFYKALSNGVSSVPPDTPSEWELYSDDIYNYVLDADITKAFAEAKILFNTGLFETDSQIQLAYLYLTAHYLVNDIQTANQGLQSSASFPVNSRSVGSVSESYSIPDRYLKDPAMSFYTRSGYGLKYLSLVLPKLVGNVISVQGKTQA